MANDKIHIKTDSGEIVEALAPVIISASRSTDIPAFYAKWFFNRLVKGYCFLDRESQTDTAISART